MRFNPRAREGRDQRGGLLRTCHAPVSIHAPARGATRKHGSLQSKSKVSIHAPARGATAIGSVRSNTQSFNPRAREGRD